MSHDNARWHRTPLLSVFSHTVEHWWEGAKFSSATKSITSGRNQSFKLNLTTVHIAVVLAVHRYVYFSFDKKQTKN